MPKAVFYKRELEKAFYERYFQQAEWVRNVAEIAVIAEAEAKRCGLAAMDALHVAAAHLAGAGELITTEKPFTSIYRSSLTRVVYLYA